VLSTGERGRILLLVFVVSLPFITVSQTTPFIKGADVSFVNQVEAGGGAFFVNGVRTDLFDLLAGNGLNFIRLRLWHTPLNGANTLSETIGLAQRARDAGLGILLDIHYSDSWADPGQQTKPAAWSTLSFAQLKDSVYWYTRDVVTAMRSANVLPEIVQIGNEIICGMLWDDGRVCGTFDTSRQWGQLGELADMGVQAVRDAADGEPVKVMIHIDTGGNNEGSRWFLDNFMYAGPDFDIIGLSFYPWWHGTMNDLSSNLDDLARVYKQEIILVESAYPWTLDWFDNTHNIVGLESQLHEGYPATVDGQRSFLTDVMAIVGAAPNGKGTGFFYWAPEWISAPSYGSAWENLTLFDFQGELLSSIGAFDSTAVSVPQEPSPRPFRLDQNFPNPFNPATTIRFTLERSAPVLIEVFDQLGQRTAVLVDQYLEAGPHAVTWDATEKEGGPVSAGVYFYRLASAGKSAHGKMILLE